MDGKRRRGTPKTSYNSNITKWMGENIDQITRDSRKRARSRQTVRGVACLIPCLSHVIISPDWTAKEDVKVLSDEFTLCVYLSVDVEQSHNEWIRNVKGCGGLLQAVPQMCSVKGKESEVYNGYTVS